MLTDPTRQDAATSLRWYIILPVAIFALRTLIIGFIKRDQDHI